MEHETWRWSDDGLSLLNQDGLPLLHIKPSDASQQQFDLIAAAPDLLAALKAMWAWQSGVQELVPEDVSSRVQRAVAKAKGES